MRCRALLGSDERRWVCKRHLLTYFRCLMSSTPSHHGGALKLLSAHILQEGWHKTAELAAEPSKPTAALKALTHTACRVTQPWVHGVKYFMLRVSRVSHFCMPASRSVRAERNDLYPVTSDVHSPSSRDTAATWAWFPKNGYTPGPMKSSRWQLHLQREPVRRSQASSGSHSRFYCIFKSDSRFYCIFKDLYK